MEDLAQHILDIAINSLEAGAGKIEITVLEDTDRNIFQFTIRDDGRGIGNTDLQKVMNPFYTTKKGKRVGLGLPLLNEAVQRCGGELEIRALPRRGTEVKAVFPHDHLDRAPLGDIAGTLVTLLAGYEALHLTYTYIYNGKQFSFDTSQLQTSAECPPSYSPTALLLLEEYLNNMAAELRLEDKYPPQGPDPGAEGCPPRTEIRRDKGEKLGRTG